MNAYTRVPIFVAITLCIGPNASDLIRAKFVCHSFSNPFSLSMMNEIESLAFVPPNFNPSLQDIADPRVGSSPVPITIDTDLDPASRHLLYNIARHRIVDSVSANLMSAVQPVSRGMQFSFAHSVFLLVCSLLCRA